MVIVDGATFLNHRKHFQSYTRIVHQTMKKKDLMKTNSWTHFHPEALHVRWSDSDNDILVHDYFSNFTFTYDKLVLTVQKTDFTRLLYMYLFGGVYADKDYNLRRPIFDYLEVSENPIHILESPFLINEVFQNSLMYSRYKHDLFFLQCMKNIKQIVNFIDEGCNVSSSCNLIYLFKNPFTSSFVNLLLTQYMTGPALLDKTFVQHNNHNIKLLDKQSFFDGPYGFHAQENSWVTLVRTALPIVTILLFMFTGLFACIFLSITRKPYYETYSIINKL